MKRISIKKRRKMSCKEFFSLSVGAKVVIDWAKDDDRVNAYRLKFKKMKITKVDGPRMFTGPEYEWSWDEIVRLKDNKLDTGRGIAKLYKPN